MVTIHEAIREIVSELGRVVSAREVIEIINNRYPRKWKESAVYAHLYGCSVNNPPAYTQHPSMPKFLFDHRKRRYELYNLEKHGRWSKGHSISDIPSGEASVETKAEEREEVSFGLERDLEEHISRNLNQLEEGLRLYSAQFSFSKGEEDRITEKFS